MALDTAEIVLKVDGSGAIVILDKVSNSTKDLRQEQARLALEMKAVDASIAALNKQYAQHTAPAVRSEIVQRTAALRAERAEIVRQTAALKEAESAFRRRNNLPGAGDELRRTARDAGAARNAVFAFAQGVEDASYATGGLGQVLRYSGNNLVNFVTQLGYAGAAAKGTAGGLRVALVGSLTGIGGVVAALSIGLAAFELFNRRLRETGETAEETAKRVRDVVDSILRVNATPISLSVDTSQLDAAVTAAERQGERIRRLLAFLSSGQGLTPGTFQGQAFLPPVDDAGFLRALEVARLQGQQVVLTREQREEVERLATANERVVEQLREQRDEARLRNAAIRVARGAGGRPQELIERASLEAIADARERALEAERRRYAEELEMAGDNAEAREAVEARHLTAVAEINERHSRQATTRALRDARRLAEERADLLQKLDVERLLTEREREVAAVEQTMNERLRIVAGNAEAEALVREIAARRIAEIERKAAEEVLARGVEAERAEFDLAQRGREIEGASRRELLEALGALLDQQLADVAEAVGEEVELWVKLDRERESAALDLQAVLAEVEDRRLEKVKDAAEREAAIRQAAADREKAAGIRAAEEERRRLQARARDLQRFLTDALDAVADAALYQRGITDAEADLQALRFRQEEDALAESLRKREITSEEYHLRLRRLAEERAEFEERVERDKAGALARITVNLRDLALQAGEDVLKQTIARVATELLLHGSSETAKTLLTQQGVAARVGALAVEGAESLLNAGKTMVSAVASLIASIVKVIPFPLNLLAIGGGIAALLALFAGAKSALGFAGGGYIGRPGEGGRDDTLIRVGRGEAILNRHQQRYVNRALLETYGLDLPALFRREPRPHSAALDRAALFAVARPAGFASGGFVGGPAAATLDLSPLIAEVRKMAESNASLAQEVRRMKQNPPPMPIGDHQARRIMRMAERQARASNPRRPL